LSWRGSGTGGGGWLGERGTSSSGTRRLFFLRRPAASATSMPVSFSSSSLNSISPCTDGRSIMR
jgi:hypothetical protein